MSDLALMFVPALSRRRRRVVLLERGPHSQENASKSKNDPGQDLERECEEFPKQFHGEAFGTNVTSILQIN